MVQSDIIVHQDRTTVVRGAEVSVGDDTPATVDLEPDTATLRLGDGEGRDEEGLVGLPQSVTVSVRGVEPRRTDDGVMQERVYVSGLMPPEATVNAEEGPWGEYVPLAMAGGEARVSVGSRGEHGLIHLLQAEQEGTATETGRLDARTATIRVGAGGTFGDGEPGTVTARNSYGLTSCELDAETATLTLGNGGITVSGDDTDDDPGGVTDSVQTEPISTPGQVQGAVAGQGSQPGAVELVDGSGSTAGYVRVDEESDDLVIADSTGTVAFRVDEGAVGREVVLTDEDGNAALTVEADGTVLVDGAEVET